MSWKPSSEDSESSSTNEASEDDFKRSSSKSRDGSSGKRRSRMTEAEVSKLLGKYGVTIEDMDKFIEEGKLVDLFHAHPRFGQEVTKTFFRDFPEFALEFNDREVTFGEDYINNLSIYSNKASEVPREQEITDMEAKAEARKELIWELAHKCCTPYHEFGLLQQIQSLLSRVLLCDEVILYLYTDDKQKIYPTVLECPSASQSTPRPAATYRPVDVKVGTSVAASVACNKESICFDFFSCGGSDCPQKGKSSWVRCTCAEFPDSPKKRLSVICQVMEDCEGDSIAIFEIRRSFEKGYRPFTNNDARKVYHLLLWGGITLHQAVNYTDLMNEKKCSDLLAKLGSELFQEITSIDQQIQKISQFARQMVLRSSDVWVFLVDSTKGTIRLKTTTSESGSTQKKSVAPSSFRHTQTTRLSSFLSRGGTNEPSVASGTQQSSFISPAGTLAGNSAGISDATADSSVFMSSMDIQIFKPLKQMESQINFSSSTAVKKEKKDPSNIENNSYETCTDGCITEPFSETDLPPNKIFNKTTFDFHRNDKVQGNRNRLGLYDGNTFGEKEIFESATKGTEPIKKAVQRMAFEVEDDDTSRIWPLETGISGRAAFTGKTYNVCDVENSKYYNESIDNLKPDLKIRSLLSVPVFTSEKMTEKNEESHLYSSDHSSTTLIHHQPAGKNVCAVITVVSSSDCLFSSREVAAMKHLASYCGLALHNGDLYDRLNSAELKRTIIMDMHASHTQPNKREWEKFNIISNTKPWNPELETLEYFGWHEPALEKVHNAVQMYERLFNLTSYSIEKLKTFFLVVYKNYRSTLPYHNFHHAFEVCQKIFSILHSCQHQFTVLESLGLFIAGICHDIDHRGRTNRFMIEQVSTIGLLHSESSMEFHHFRMAVQILAHPQTNFLVDWPKEGYNLLVECIKYCIICTDLPVGINHSREMPEEDFCWNDPEHRKLLMSIIMTSTDLHGSFMPFPQQRYLVEQLLGEFWEQGDLERAKDITPEPIMDRNKANEQPSIQVKFLTYVPIPVVNHLVTVFPEAKVWVDNCKKNIQIWSTTKHFQLNQDKRSGTFDEARYYFDPNIGEDERDQTRKSKKPALKALSVDSQRQSAL